MSKTGISVKIGNSHTDLVQVYAVHRPLAENEVFYEDLQDLTDKIPQRQSLIIMANLKGHVGNDRNHMKNGKITDNCIRNQLTVMNTFSNIENHTNERDTGGTRQQRTSQ